MQLREEIFKSAALGLLQDLLESKKVTFEQLDDACGWDPGELGSRVWDQEAFSVEDLCELLLAAEKIPIDRELVEDRPLDEFDVLFKAAGFREAPLFAKAERDEGTKPEDAWSGRLLELIARYLLQEVVSGRYSAQKLGAVLLNYAELAQELDGMEKDS